MSRPTIFISKFVGTISLGLLTGSSLTLSLLTLPPLLSLPALTPAITSFAKLRRSAATYQTYLSALSLTSLVLAYSVSPRGARHPYMLWTAATVATSWGIGRWRGDAGEMTVTGRDERPGRRGMDEVNGEAVREEMEAWRWGQALRSAVWGLGWGMSVVGIWGDGV